jgi:hypothetical protein
MGRAIEKERIKSAARIAIAIAVSLIFIYYLNI